MKNAKFDGCVVFNGKLNISTAGGYRISLRLDMGGNLLRVCDPYKEIVILDRDYAYYNELHTGYATKQDETSFRLRMGDSDHFTVLDYSDIIAWGYVE